MKLLSVAYENNTYNIIYFKFFQEEKKNTLNSLCTFPVEQKIETRIFKIILRKKL